MVLLVLPYLVQIGFLIHAIKTGRNSSWIWLLIVLPYVGAVVYFVVEVVPDLRRQRLDPQAVAALFDKRASVKRLQDEVSLSNTVANRIALAEEYDRLGDHTLAFQGYRAELTGFYANDSGLQLKAAKSAFLAGDYPEAHRYFQLALTTTPTSATQVLTWAAYAHWQVSRTPEALGRLEELFGLYKTTETGRYLCQAYGILGDRSGIDRTVATSRLQLSKLTGPARKAAQANLKLMEAAGKGTATPTDS